MKTICVSNLKLKIDVLNFTQISCNEVINVPNPQRGLTEFGVTKAHFCERTSYIQGLF